MIRKRSPERHSCTETRPSHWREIPLSTYPIDVNALGVTQEQIQGVHRWVDEQLRHPEPLFRGGIRQ